MNTEISTGTRPETLQDLVNSGWTSKSVKQELQHNFLQALASNEDLYPGIIGYNDTVIPELNIALLSGHDMLFLGEKGQAKSRLMRSLIQFLDPVTPYLDVADSPFHEDPLNPLSQSALDLVAEKSPEKIRLKWWGLVSYC